MEKIVKFFSDRFITICLGFIVGIFIGSVVGYSSSFLTFSVSFIFVVWVYIKREIRNEFLHYHSITILLFIVSVMLGVIRFGVKDMHHLDENLMASVGGKVSLEGIIVEEPVIRDSFVEYRVKTLDFGGEKILIRAEPFPLFLYGDQVMFQGGLEVPGVFNQSNGKVFDYREYLAKDDIYFVLSFSKGTLISSGYGNIIIRTLLTIKARFRERMVRFIREPESNLARGLLLGDSHSLGGKWEDVFRQVGLSHIVVLSGYNITIVAQSILRFLYFVPTRVSLWGSVIGVVLFSIMVGGGPSVMRASLFAILVLVARVSGRDFNIGRVFLFVVALMLVGNPKLLIFDLGFQLSFIATAALIWATPLLERKLMWCTQVFGLRSIIASTLATQLSVAPLLLYSIGSVSLVGLIVNVFVLPMIPFAMMLCFTSGVFGFLPILSLLVAFISQFVLSYVFIISEFFAEIPFATVGLKSFSIVSLCIAYGAICLFFFKLKQKKSTQ